MHLAIELLVLVGYGLFAAHAWHRHRVEGLAFFGALLYLGFVRESFVALYDLLYGFASLTFTVGDAPLIAAVIWGFSIYAAVVWTEAMGWGTAFAGETSGRAGVGFYGGTALFMAALACFYEPFLERFGMARWEAGTRTTLGVPWIALVGYPTLTVPFLGLWQELWLVLRRRFPPLPRTVLLAVALTLLALAHAWGLKALKTVLGW